MIPFPPPASTHRVLEVVRQARFVDGVACPHCGSRSVGGWGSFAGRRRHRCRGCGRTFSDLTGTPAAYTKRLDLWLPYSYCMAASLSIRAAAARVGVHPSTAFRWRHRLLDELRIRDFDTISGHVELDTVWFQYSEKGKRGARAPHPKYLRCYKPRGRPPLGGVGPLLGANVVIACDRPDTAVTNLVNVSTRHRIDRSALQAFLAARAPHTALAALYANPLRFAVATFVRWPHQPPFVARTTASLKLAWGYRERCLSWIARFRGVATRYLANYLIWHRRVHRRAQHHIAARLLQWPVSGRRAVVPLYAARATQLA